MGDFFSCVISSNGLAYFTGLAIFLLTAFLVTRNLIGVTTSIVFLIFALFAALGIAHQDSVKGYVDRYTTPQTAQERETRLNEDLQKGFDDLKAEFLIYKQKFEDFVRDQQQPK